MYLVDAEIIPRLDELKIEAPHSGHPFDAKAQVQPCSIDLRLDNVIWKPGRRRVVDLRRSVMETVRPDRAWLSSKLPENSYVEIRPNEMIFARVYERFQMPANLAGKIEGRSSYARMGLSVHCTQDFINPGWRGNMPLQLFNAGPHTIRIPPYAPVCQLKLIALNRAPDRRYGHDELESKYQNDDGGPSFWWRDQLIKRVHERIKERNLPMAIEEQIAEMTRGREIEILDRFEKHVAGAKQSKLSDPDRVIDRFAWWERTRKYGRIAATAVSVFAFLTFLGLFASDSRGEHFKLIDRKNLETLIPAAVFGVISACLRWWRARTGYLLPSDVMAFRTEQALRSRQSEEPSLPDGKRSQ